MSSDGKLLVLGKSLRARKAMLNMEDTYNATAARSEAPAAISWSIFAARGCAVASLLLVSVWVHGYLGGIGFAAPDGSNTDQLFNWHPILMTFAFAVLMTEAVLAYRAPWQSQFSRPLKKQVHWILHSSALVLGFFGFLAAYKSHTLKIPPIANFYSPHSFIGSAALLLFLGQYVIGFVSYLYPQTAIEKRVALGPFHRFYGLAVYCTGMAAAAESDTA